MRKETILQVAIQCPSSGGSSVHRARIFIAQVNDSMEYNDGDVCATLGIFRMADSNGKNNLEPKLICFPNPASYSLQLLFNGLNGTEFNLEIHDSSGRLISSKKFTSVSGACYLNTSSLSDGLFHILVRDSAGKNVNSIGPSNFDTDKYGFTASGAALNEIALALKGQNVIAHRIDFDNLLVQKIQYFNSINSNWVTTDYLDLYGWCFEKESGTEAIILNLGPNEYRYQAFDNVGRYNGSNVSFESMVQLTSSDQTAGNGGVLPLGSTPPFAIDEPIFTTNEINISSSAPLILPGYSLTRLIFRDPSILSIRLTDDEICVGSETSVIISGMPFGSTCTLYCNSTSQNYSFQSADSVFEISGLVEGEYTITATAGTATSPLTPPTILTVHAPIIAVEIATIPDPILPCSSSVTLTANVAMTSGSGSLVNDYCYLWVPDKHIIGNPPNQPTPFSSSINVDLTNLKTEAYQVYVYNDQCWASSAPLVIERSPISVDLGKDFTTCTSADFTLNPQVIQSPYSSEQNLLFKLTGDNAPTNVQSTPEFNISGLSAGLHTYTIEVWLEDGGSTFSGCPATTDEIIVNVVNCCSCSSNVVTLLPISHEEYTTYGHPRETYIDETEFIDAAIRSSYFGTSIASGNGIKQTVTITGNNNTYSTFCINGELWLRSEIFDVNQRLEKLVLQKCTLKLGPDAKIRIRGKVTLVLEGCIIEKCDGSTELWDGIYADIEDEATTEPEIVIDQFGTQPTQIRDAKNAIVIRRDSPYKIQHGEFTDNYIDIKFEKCKKIINQGKSGISSTDMSTNNYIRSCTFTSAGTTLITPYSTAHKFAAITLNDVERVVIGDSSLNVLVSENEFSYSNYGIYSNNSSFDCYHSTFSDITDFGGAPWSKPIKGVCIYSQSSSDYNDRSMNVGVTTADETLKNYFLKSNYGVLSYGEMNAKIFNNEFGDLNDIDNRITNTGIFTVNSSSKKVYISRNNNFYFYNIGIRAIGLNSFGEYHIGNNYFSYTMTIPTNPLNFEGTAIWVGNSYFLRNTNTPPNLQIFENDFGSLLDLAGQPRIGIFVSLANTPIVQNNRIYFDHSSAPSVPTLGIWMQNTQNAFINENDIINTATSSTLTNLFLGIRSDRNLTPCISDNTIDYLGNSMQFLGDHGQVSLSKNKMHFYDNAISLIGANIGVQGFFDISNNDSRSDENEFHHTNTGFQPNRVIGSVGNINLPLSWYFNSSNNQIENPDINNSISQAFLAEQGVAPTLEAIECPIITDPVARNMAFGSVIGDSTRYDENYYDFFYQNSRVNLYSILKADISLLNMEDEADSSFEAFYNTMNASNIEKFDSIRSQIEIGDYNSALQILNTINDTINFERELKNVLSICLNRSIVDSSLTSNDSTIFYEIANENQLLYGEASIVTRNWLFYEVHDGALSQESRIANSNEKIETKFEVTIFPNPTTENLFLKYKEIVPQQIKVLDINQRVILNSNNINYLILKNIDAGVYFVQFIKNGRILRTHKIVKL